MSFKDLKPPKELNSIPIAKQAIDMWNKKIQAITFNFGQTQALSIGDQLKAGIRFLDFRLIN